MSHQSRRSGRKTVRRANVDPIPNTILTTSSGAVTIHLTIGRPGRGFTAVVRGPPAALSRLDGTDPRRRTRLVIRPDRPIGRLDAAQTWLDRLLPAWRRAITATNSGTPAVSGTMSLIDCQALRGPELHGAIKPVTLAMYRVKWRRWNRVLGDASIRPIVRLTRDRLQAAIQTLADQGVASTTVRAMMTALRQALDPAIRAGCFDAGRLHGLDLPRPVARRGVILTPDHRDRLLKRATQAGRDLHLLIALGLLAGLRRSEILDATWNAVDLDHRLLRIASAPNQSTTRSQQASPRSIGSHRTIPLCEALVDLLRLHRCSAAPTDLIVAPDHPPIPGSGPGTPRWCYAKAFARLAASIGCSGLRVHDLRRAFATSCTANGISIWKVKRWLGHASLRTIEHYAEAAWIFDPDIDRITA